MTCGRPVEILLVEDNVGDIRLTQEALKDARVANNLSVANDGVEALAFLHRKGAYGDAPRPDLILLDLNLPRKSGREVLTEIKDHPDFRRIPVIVLTTSQAESDIRHSYDLHANSFVTKPLDLDQFFAVMESIEKLWLTVATLPTMGPAAAGSMANGPATSGPGPEGPWQDTDPEGSAARIDALTSEDTTTQHTTLGQASSAEGTPSVHVLLVEDNPADAYLVRAMLAEGSTGGARFTVTHVERLVTALERIGDGDADIVMLDLSLPDARGLEIVTRVHTAAPGLPIVIMSGNQDEALAIQGVREGAQDYLVKGQVETGALVRALRYAIERQQAEERLTFVATHDALTGLPNRALFHDRLDQTLRAAQRPARPDGEPTPFGLLLIDLNRFKDVNDTLGHHVGDALLQQVGARAQGALRAADTVARLGGDEFAVLLPGSDAAGAITVSNRIVSALDSPLAIDGRTLDVGASIGVALYPAHGADGAALLRHADVAMYSAKRSGGGYAVYDAVQDEHSPARLTLTRDVRQALDEKAFRLRYHPVFDLGDERPCRVEALPRWTHPVHGEIGPDQAVPLAEQAGIALPLTAWVLDEALRQCVLWDRAEHGPRVDIAVNISPRALHHPRLSSLVTSLLNAHGVTPARLTLEIAENALMADSKESLVILTRLKTLGVRLAIDDFGTGYSSLTYLRQLPIDEIKIDRSFIGRMSASARDATLSRSIIAVARAFGLGVVAAGVETRETWELLQALGCPAAQGAYMSAPLPAEALEELLR